MICAILCIIIAVLGFGLIIGIIVFSHYEEKEKRRIIVEEIKKRGRIMRFEIPKEKFEQFNVWREEQDKIAAEMQKEDELIMQLQEDVGITLPYCGATGGCLKFIFIPCSIGMTIKVEHLFTKNVLDLTDVEDW